MIKCAVVNGNAIYWSTNNKRWQHAGNNKEYHGSNPLTMLETVRMKVENGVKKIWQKQQATCLHS